jgi:hypothetical protein
MEPTNMTEMPPPVNTWVMETGSFYLWPLIFVLCAAWALRTRKFPVMLLILLAASSSFWQEFFGDWGAYLSWNPAFARLPFWGDMAYTTPVKPVFIPLSWGWWFALSITPLLMLTIWLARKFPALSSSWWALITVAPLYSAYELYAEGSAVAQSWWSYNAVIGPQWTASNGAGMSLIWPVILAFWAAWVVALLAKKDENGQWWHERKLGVAATGSGWTHEIKRLGAFILMFQVTFLLVVTLPPIIARLMFGGPSLLVP